MPLHPLKQTELIIIKIKHDCSSCMAVRKYLGEVLLCLFMWVVCVRDWLCTLVQEVTTYLVGCVFKIIIVAVYLTSSSSFHIILFQSAYHRAYG